MKCFLRLSINRREKINESGSFTGQNCDLKFAFIDGGPLPLKHLSRRIWLVPSLASHCNLDAEIIPSPRQELSLNPAYNRLSPESREAQTQGRGI